MDIELNEEQIAFVQVAKDFAAGMFAPHAALWDEKEIFPRDALSQAGALGFCGLYASTEIGGLGLSRLDASLVFEEMAAIDPSTTAFLTIHNMATWMVGQWGSQALRQAWGPALSMGEKLASYCLTESGAGSDAASLRTSAKVDQGQYILNGAKAFISGAGETDLLIVMARTGAAGANGISAFAVPSNTPGITYGRKERKMGWNSQSTRSVFWVKRARASKLRCEVSMVGESTLRHAQSGPLKAPSIQPVTTCNIASNSINLSQAFRRCNLNLQTW